jgi:hypothetical protein
MSLSDTDFELLETYLDGELSTHEEDALRQRMAGDPALAAAMETVKAEREVRALVWKSCEPTEASIRRLISRVDAAVDRHTVWAYRLSKLRIASAAAACIVLGILIGRVGNSGPGSPEGPGLAQLNHGQQGIPGQPGITNVSAPVELPIVDESGQSMGVQRFRTTSEANEFFEDLSRFQRQQEQIRNGGGNMIQSERF